MLGLGGSELCGGTEIIGHTVDRIGLLDHGHRDLPIPGLQVGMDLIHHLFPDPPGIGAAKYARHSPGDIVAYPDRGGVVAGIAAEPGIFIAVSSAGLPGAGHPAGQPQSPARAVGGGHGPL